MKTTSIWKKIAAAGLLMISLGGTGTLVGGCGYAGVAAAPDGTIVIARNDYFLAGLLRKVFVCKANGSQLVCSETAAP
jgi:hypothetical protein